MSELSFTPKTVFIFLGSLERHTDLCGIVCLFVLVKREIIEGIKFICYVIIHYMGRVFKSEEIFSLLQVKFVQIKCYQYKYFRYHIQCGESQEICQSPCCSQYVSIYQSQCCFAYYQMIEVLSYQSNFSYSKTINFVKIWFFYHNLTYSWPVSFKCGFGALIYGVLLIQRCLGYTSHRITFFDINTLLVYPYYNLGILILYYVRIIICYK